MSEKLSAGAEMPVMSVARLGGGTVEIGGARDGWSMLVVYRGVHCPLCKRYLSGLKDLKAEYDAAGIAIAAVSADSEDQARAFNDELDLNFDLGYGLTKDQMAALGVYVSDPRSEQETNHQFPEPGLFVVNPAGRAQIIDISNAPFSRPDLGSILNGIKFVKEKDYPIRGMAA